MSELLLWISVLIMRENALISGVIHTTAAGSDSRDKSHRWTILVSFCWELVYFWGFLTFPPPSSDLEHAQRVTYRAISYIVMMKLTCSHWRHRNHKKNQGYGPPLLPDPLGLFVMFWSDHFWTPPLAFHAIPWVPPHPLGIILTSLFNTPPHF